MDVIVFSKKAYLKELLSPDGPEKASAHSDSWKFHHDLGNKVFFQGGLDESIHGHIRLRVSPPASAIEEHNMVQMADINDFVLLESQTSSTICGAVIYSEGLFMVVKLAQLASNCSHIPLMLLHGASLEGPSVVS
jgi:hypothetical protein